MVTETKAIPTQQPTMEDLQNQADADSEVSQINTQPPVNESSADYVRPQSRSTSSAVSRKCYFTLSNSIFLNWFSFFYFLKF